MCTQGFTSHYKRSESHSQNSNHCKFVVVPPIIMDNKFFFLVGILVVSLALITGGTGDRDAEKETETTFEELFSAPDDDDLFAPPNQDEKVYHYTSEEIERNRWISLSRDGVETTETDEEVIKILEFARHDNATSRFSESSNFTSDELYQATSKEKRAIIGYDNRYKYPYLGLRSKSCTIGIMENGCTAFFIGPRHAITAGHCVYNTANRRWNRDLGIYVGRDCNSYGRFIDWSRAWVFTSYINGDFRSNMAYILLSRTSSCWLGFGFRDPMPRTRVESCGYHGDRRHTSRYACYHCSNCYAQLEVTGSWLSRTTYYTRMRNTCDNFRAPGAPMVVSTGHAWGVATQESSSYNYAARITKQKFYTLCQWMCNNGATCTARC